MKITDIKKGQSYVNKAGVVKRTVRDIAKPANDHRLHVYFGENGRMCNIPIHHFADWAHEKVN